MSRMSISWEMAFAMYRNGEHTIQDIAKKVGKDYSYTASRLGKLMRERLANNIQELDQKLYDERIIEFSGNPKWMNEILSDRELSYQERKDLIDNKISDETKE